MSFLQSTEFVSFIQSFSFLDGPMQFFSFLGSESVYLWGLAILYWTVNRPLAARIGVLLFLSTSLKDVLKWVFAWSRPYWFVPSLQKATEYSLTFPSGHAQNAAVVWPLMALNSRKPKIYLPLSFLCVILIALSRIYLGLHFLSDAIAGVIIGLLILIASNQIEKNGLPLWIKRPQAQQMALVLLASLILGTSYWLALKIGSTNFKPARYSPELFVLQNEMGTAFARRLGSFTGWGLGLVMLSHVGNFETKVGVIEKLIRLSFGACILLFLHNSFTLLLPTTALVGFLKFAVASFWIAYGAPRCWQLLPFVTPSSELVTTKAS